MLGAKGLNKLLVALVLAVLVEDAHVGLATVEGLGALTETAGKTVVDEGVLQDTLEGILNRHVALGGVSGDLNLLLNLGNLSGMLAGPFEFGTFGGVDGCAVRCYLLRPTS